MGSLSMASVTLQPQSFSNATRSCCAAVGRAASAWPPDTPAPLLLLSAPEAGCCATPGFALGGVAACACCSSGSQCVPVEPCVFVVVVICSVRGL
jgi:hypothetical protein